MKRRLILFVFALGLANSVALAQNSPNQQDPQTQDAQQQQPQGQPTQDQQQQQPQGQQTQDPQQQQPQGQQPVYQPQTTMAPIRPGKVAPMRPADPGKVAPMRPADPGRVAPMRPADIAPPTRAKVVPVRPARGRDLVPSTRRQIETPYASHQNTLSRYVGPETPDLDGDGHRAIQHVWQSERGPIRGDDCDDGNPNRYPGNPETADFRGNDEDCDVNTIGVMDRDGDGYTDHRVWNAYFNYLGPEKRGIYGDDCDDTRRGVNPGVPEIPGNGLDDNCDGDVDFDESWPTRPSD